MLASSSTAMTPVRPAARVYRCCTAATRRALIAPILFALWTGGGWAVIMVTEGNHPVSDMGWPAGSVAVANLPSRIAHWDGEIPGGHYHFQYAGGTAQFQATLDAFAAIEAPRRELYVYDGGMFSPQTNRTIQWELVVWSAEQFLDFHERRKSLWMSESPWFGRPLPAPRLNLFLGEGNRVDWAAVRLPDGVTLLDRRVASSPWADSTGGVAQVVLHDIETGMPLTGATIEVGRLRERSFQPDDSAATGADGEAVIRDLPPGSYLIRARLEGYATRELGNFENYGRTLGIFDDAALAPAAVLSGRVTDAAGAPLPDVEIGVGGLVGTDGIGYSQNLFNEHTITRTDADGRFTLEGLPHGQLALRVKKPGYHFFSRDSFPVPGEALSITMTVTGWIHGRVAGAEQLAEGREAHVKLAPVGDPIGRWGGYDICEPDGSFSFEGIPADLYTLTPYVMPPGMTNLAPTNTAEDPAAREIHLQSGQDLNVNLELKLEP